MAPEGLAHRRRHEHDARGVGDGVERRGHRGGRGGVGGLEHQGQRAVHPGAEALGEQVVGLPGGRTGGIVAGVGHGQAHAEGGGGQQRAGPRPRPRRPRPAGAARRGAQRWAIVSRGARRVRRRCTLRRSIRRPTTPSSAGSRVTAPSTATSTAVDVPRARPSRKLSRISSSPSSEIIDGAAGEHHGPPGGAHGLDRGVVGRQAPLQRGAVAGDDEQGVVDAHADADHRWRPGW